MKWLFKGVSGCEPKIAQCMDWLKNCSIALRCSSSKKEKSVISFRSAMFRKSFDGSTRLLSMSWKSLSMVSSIVYSWSSDLVGCIFSL